MTLAGVADCVTLAVGYASGGEEEFGVWSSLRGLWIRWWESDTFLDRLLMELTLAF